MMKSRALWLTVLILLGIIGLPDTAHAQLTLQTCAPGHMPWEYTSIVVDCLQGAIMGATNTMMQGFSTFMMPTVAAATVLSIAIFGMRIAGGGEPELLPKAAAFLMRMCLVLFFSYDLGGFSNSFFGIESELVALVSGGFSPWNQMDYFLGMLFGFGQGLQLYQGLMGLVASALFTSVPGMMMFGAGVMGIVKLLLFVFDVVYLYLSALIVMGFMLLLSPLVVPLALFQQGERYVKKWIDILIMSMLTPVLLFAFLFMFLSIFTLLVGNIFNSLGGNDFQAFWQINQPAFSKAIGGAPMIVPDPNQLEEQKAISSMNITPDPVEPAVAGNITPQLSQAFDAGSIFQMPGIDFGPDTMIMMQSVGFGFVTLAIFAAIMQTMIHGIPQLASSICGVLTQIPLQITTSPKARMQELAGNAKLGLSSAVGALAGSGMAGSMKKNEATQGARQAGGIVSGLAGKMAGTKSSAPVARQTGGIIGGTVGAFLGR